MNKTDFRRGIGFFLLFCLCACGLSSTTSLKPTAIGGKSGYIAFLSNERRKSLLEYELYVVDPETLTHLQWTALPLITESYSWSFDKQRIAFQHDYDIYIIGADGSHLRRLTNSSPSPESVSDYSQPVWSPTGNEIAFVSNNIDTGGAGYDIYRINADGTGQLRLTFDVAVLNGLAWSPDGKRIVYATSRDAGLCTTWCYQIYSMNADGSDVKRLTETGSNYSPQFSPDGKQIVFISDRDHEVKNGIATANEIYIMGQDGLNQKRITSLNEILSSVTWSPDGKRLAYIQRISDVSESIYALNVADFSQTDKIFSGMQLHDLQWLP